MSESAATVVLVHGLFMRRPIMLALAWRLQRAGYRTCTFSYDTTGLSCADNARHLQRFVANLGTTNLHFVAHSLGGLVLRHWLSGLPGAAADCTPERTGRLVTLGTPHQGSDFARRLATYSIGRRLLGSSLERCLLGGAPALPPDTCLGSLAGDFSLGMGRTLPGLPRPNDGMVPVAETRLAGMHDHVVLPVSHTGMLFSPSVAAQVSHFLTHGRFDKDGG